MDRTCATHFLKSPTQRLPTPVKSDGHIVQGGAEAGGQPVARLTENIRAPHDVRVLGLQRGQQTIETVADCSIELGVRKNGLILEIALLDLDFPSSPSICTAMMVDDGCGEYPSEPATHGADIAQLMRTFQSPQRKCLQNLLGEVMIPKALLEELENLLPRLDQCALNSCIVRLTAASLYALGRLVLISVVFVRHHPVDPERR